MRGRALSLIILGASAVAATGCSPTVYVRQPPPPPPPAPVTVVTRPAPPIQDPNWQRAEDLRRQAQVKRAEAVQHHNGAVQLTIQANGEQMAADRDFGEGRALDRESFALLRDQRRVEAQMLWHRADREEREASLLDGRSHDGDSAAAREEATARDEQAAAQRLRDGATRERDPGQRRRLEEEARALDAQAQEDLAEAQRDRQAGDPYRAKIAQLRSQAQADRAAALRLDPHIAE